MKTGKCNGPQTRSLGLANKGGFEPTLCANMRDREPTFGSSSLLILMAKSEIHTIYVRHELENRVCSCNKSLRNPLRQQYHFW
jgi:hypothetical protein